MDQTKTDLVMKFTLTPENDVPAEGVVDIDPHDDLMWDFHGATYDDYSNFFEITDFSMKMQLKPDDDHQSKTTSSHGHTSTPHAQHIAQQVKNGSADEWSRWRSATTANEMRTIKYPFYVENLTFDRTIDSASPIFFQYLLQTAEVPQCGTVQATGSGQSRRKHTQGLSADRIHRRDDHRYQLG